MEFRFRVKVDRYFYAIIEADNELDALIKLREKEREEMAKYTVLETIQVTHETFIR